MKSNRMQKRRKAKKLEKSMRINMSLIIVLSCITLISLFFAFRIVNPEAAGSDRAGYLLNSKILSGEFETKNQKPTFMKNVDLNCGSLDEMLTARLVTDEKCTQFERFPSYPSGVGLMHFFATKIFGENNFARKITSTLSMGLLILFTLSLVWDLTRNWSLLFTMWILIISSKQMLFSTNSNLSDLPSAMWIAASNFIFYHMYKFRNLNRFKRFAYPLMFGISCWMVFLTREVNLLALIPLVVGVLFLKETYRTSTIISLFLFSIPALYIRYKINGVLLTDSYGGSLWSVMRLDWVSRGIGNQFYSLLIFLGIGIILVIPKVSKKYLLESIFSLQITLILFFYMFYEFMGETWWDGRFILGIFPSAVALIAFRLGLLAQKRRPYNQKSTHFLSGREFINYSAIIILVSTILVNNLIKFPNSAPPYNYLVFELPSYRTTEEVINYVKNHYPRNTIIVTTDFSASGRYYLGNQYKFLWKPTLETLSYEQITSEFPSTVWIYEPGYFAPPKRIVDKFSNSTLINGVYIAELR